MKTFWAALLAVVVGGIITTILGFVILASLAAMMGDTAPEIKSNSILKIDLTGGLSDSPSSSPFSVDIFGGISFSKSNTLIQALAAIEKAAADPKIKGIYIDLSEAGSAGLAHIEELRQALEQFKESGKFVVSYGDSYSQIGYYFSSVADVVLLNPVGDLQWTGLSMSVMFYKGLLEKLDVKPQIVRHGSFKAAIEPYILESMSDENRLQNITLINAIWRETILPDIAQSRGIDMQVLDNYASDLSIRSARHALEYGLVDALVYRDQAEWFLKKLVGGESVTGTLSLLRSMGITAGTEDKEDKLVTVSLGRYIDAGVSIGSKTSKNKIAIIYADGTIVDSGNSDEYVVGTDVAARLARARRDERTKAVVLRVNSPGGSALASELIWREVELTRQEKPVVVSMGSLAASGGYYISCPADIIVTDRTTITGSIGVFGILFDISEGMKNKLGVTVDAVRTNPSADMGSLFRTMNHTEEEALEYAIEEIYDTFVTHIAQGRNVGWDDVDAIGEGRIWSGINALEIGLVDGFGGLKDAIDLAADRAGVAEDCRVWQVVDRSEGIASLLKQLVETRAEVSIKDRLGELYMEYRTVRDVVSRPGIRAEMPYTIVIE